MNAQEKDRELSRIILERAKGSQQYGRILDHFGTIKARTLRRAQMTLHRWAEEECNGTIQREGEQGDGKPFRVWTGQLWSHHAKRMEYTERRTPCPDREAGALRRVAEVCAASGLHFYHQTDPRGCALFVSTEPLTDQNYSTAGIACL